jgi:DNA-binding MarR family transcriptional regulator
MLTKNIPQVLKPKSGSCTQPMSFWFNPNINFLTPSESTFIKVRKIIRLLQVNPSLSIREISEKTGIDTKDIPHLIGRMVDKNMIIGNGHSETKFGNEVQLRLSF